MRIILQENVEKLGTRGEVLDVADGYARNYLLPRKLAIPAQAGSLKQQERVRASLLKREADEKSNAERVAETLSQITITLSRKAGENDQLFGSVTAADIAEAIEAQGHAVDKRKVELDEPIKLIGEYQVSVKLHHNVIAPVKVIVTRDAS